MTDEEPSDSRTDSYTEDDYEEGEEVYDDEGTLDEEEMLNPEDDYGDELKMLADDANLTVEELRARYYGSRQSDEGVSTDDAESYSVHEDEAQQEEDEESEHSNAADSQEIEEAGSSSATEAKAEKPGSRGYFSDDEDNEEDADYMPPDPWRRSVRQGPFYQADIPAFISSEVKYPCPERGKLLWKPPTQLTTEEIEGYLKEFYEIDLRHSASADAADTSRLGATAQQQPLRDDENALKALMDAGYDVSSALAAFPFPAANACKISIGPNPAKWDESDCQLFEEGMRVHGKNFTLIQRTELPHRTVGELVQFYYIWKKTERHDIFEQRVRAAKRQEHVHCTDFMGRLIDHMDATTGDPTVNLPPPLDSAPAIPANLDLIATKEWTGCWQGETDDATLPHLDNDTIANVLQ